MTHEKLNAGMMTRETVQAALYQWQQLDARVDTKSPLFPEYQKISIKAHNLLERMMPLSLSIIGGEKTFIDEAKKLNELYLEARKILSSMGYERLPDVMKTAGGTAKMESELEKEMETALEPHEKMGKHIKRDILVKIVKAISINPADVSAKTLTRGNLFYFAGGLINFDNIRWANKELDEIIRSTENADHAVILGFEPLNAFAKKLKRGVGQINNNDTSIAVKGMPNRRSMDALQQELAKGKKMDWRPLRIILTPIAALATAFGLRNPQSPATWFWAMVTLFTVNPDLVLKSGGKHALDSMKALGQAHVLALVPHLKRLGAKEAEIALDEFKGIRKSSTTRKNLSVLLGKPSLTEAQIGSLTGGIKTQFYDLMKGIDSDKRGKALSTLNSLSNEQIDTMKVMVGK